MAIYAVWGPPQSGKTTVAIDLAFALSQSGQSVLIISPEPYSELSARLSVQIKKEQSLSALSGGIASLKKSVMQVDSLLYVLAVPYDYDVFDGDMSSAAAKDMLEQAAVMFDAVIVDCPSSACSVIAAWAINTADALLLLMGARSAAVLWNGSFRRAIDTAKGRTIHICNQTSKGFDYHALCSVLKLEPDIRLPYFPEADVTQESRRCLYGASGKTGKAYSEQIDELCKRLKGAEK